MSHLFPLETFLIGHPLETAVIWMALFASDYFLTLWGARLRGNQEFYIAEGSYELTQAFQKDVDRQVKVSFRAILAMVSTVVVIYAVGLIWADLPYLYGILVGALIIGELTIHARHFRNIEVFKMLGRPDPGVEGRIQFSRSFAYGRSATELSSEASVLLLLFLLTNSPMLLGGALEVGGLSYRHYRRSRSLAPVPAGPGSRPS